MAKELLRIIRDFAKLNECEIYRRASKLMMAWLIFYFAGLVFLQGETKAHYRVKHRVNEFAKGHKCIIG